MSSMLTKTFAGAAETDGLSKVTLTPKGIISGLVLSLVPSAVTHKANNEGSVPTLHEE